MIEPANLPFDPHESKGARYKKESTKAVNWARTHHAPYLINFDLDGDIVMLRQDNIGLMMDGKSEHKTRVTQPIMAHPLLWRIDF
jgi:hypothetical protein